MKTTQNNPSTSKRITAVILLLLFHITPLLLAQQAPPALLPLPQQVEWHNKQTAVMRVVVESDAHRPLIKEIIEGKGGIITQKSAIQLNITRVENIPEAPVNQEEAYRLTISKKAIHIEATNEKGEFYALQTLRQLITIKNGKPFAPCCQIVDWPAFSIRGFMHDVGRGYISIEELKREIATLSKFKINVFHWHLTEDLAWRLESKLFPMLNDSSNMMRLPGKFYTITEAKELEAFCRQHQMLLIPEIDMPGHSAAFTRALRHDMQSPEGMKLLKLLIDEVCETFSNSPYLHIGTDEVHFTNPAFVPEMVGYIRTKGKKVISWNPGWHYKAGEIDMTQMWSSRGRPTPGVPAIDSRLHYINHYDAFADIVGLYNSNIAGVKRQDEQHAGAIIALWNDRHVEKESEILLQNGFYPAILTLAERTWRGGGDAYLDQRGTMLDPEGSEGFNQFVDFENRMLHFKSSELIGLPFAYVRQSNVRWRITDPFPNGGDLTSSFPPEKALQENYTHKGKTYQTSLVNGAGIYLRHVWGKTVPAFYDNPQPNHTAYAFTHVYSPKDQTVGLWVSFQNYSRSEKDLPPQQGKWAYKESQIWINNEAVMPPVWTNTHQTKTNEIALGNENFEVREPLPIQLKKGWNKVLLKLPVGEFTTHEVRLVKWMFTAVFVTPDGLCGVNNLVYSPDKTIPQTK